jgi:hypothetical protein
MMNHSSLGRSGNGFRVPSVVVWAMEKFTGADADDLRCVVRELNLKWNVQAEVREFDFSALPDWMRINQARGWMGGTGSQINPFLTIILSILFYFIPALNPIFLCFSHNNIIQRCGPTMGCWELTLNLRAGLQYGGEVHRS